MPDEQKSAPGHIRVEVFGWVADLFGATAEHVVFQQPISRDYLLTDLLAALARGCPRFNELIFNAVTGELRSEIHIIVNGLSAELLASQQTKLKDGDIVMLLPPFSGG